MYSHTFLALIERKQLCAMLKIWAKKALKVFYYHHCLINCWFWRIHYFTIFFPWPGFFNLVHAFKDAAGQNSCMIQFITPYKTTPRKARNDNKYRKRIAVQYTIHKQNGLLIPVCQKSFSSISSVGKLTEMASYVSLSILWILILIISAMLPLGWKRLNAIVHHFLEMGHKRPEKWGGFRQTDAQKKATESIINFIKTLFAEPSHYGHGRSERQYMRSELNIRKLYDMWKEKEGDVCKASLQKFTSVFNSSFNIAFKHPKTDGMFYLRVIWITSCSSRGR